MNESTQAEKASHILLVADPASPDSSSVLEVLESLGFQIEHAANRDEGLESFRSRPPQAVLIDLESAQEAALSLCLELRELPTANATPIIMLHDGHDGDGSRRYTAACEAGATEFLERPFHPALIERRLSSALSYVNSMTNGKPFEAELVEGGRFAEVEAESGTGNQLRFLRTIDNAIDRARGTDLCVSLLHVLCTGDSRHSTIWFEARLRQAISAFEEDVPASHTRGAIQLARLAEDRFALLLPDLGRVQDTARLGQWIHRVVADADGVDASIGVAMSPKDGAQGRTLLECSQFAAQDARQTGRNSFRFHDEAMNRWVLERLTLERSLVSAIENDELRVYYQPKVDAKSGHILGFEALLRWQHPDLGMVSPMQFIPLAEETGQIISIGEWVLETACRQNKAWQDAGLEPVRMAVNLSPVQFRQPDLYETVITVLDRTGLSAHSLELEVTESMLMNDVKTTAETLRRLKQAGIYLSIDDFGTGYSSLSYLRGFPIDALKIDRSFVREVTVNSNDAAIATSIILMGHSLKLDVIAEGVETESQAAFLRVLQCDEFQGYLYSPPVPENEAVNFLSLRGE